ncbi:MAG: isochorismatase family protein [Acidobacteriota bacterium]|nr:isochorismatase family protein [Acidobacteriota bacterium]
MVAFAAALPIRATFPPASSIDPGFTRKALLILDLQKDFLARDGKLPVAADQAAALLVTANQLLDAASAKRWLPIVIFNSYAPWNVANIFRNSAAVRNSQGAEIDPALKTLGLPQFAKSEPDAFSNPGLGSFLRQHAVETVIVTRSLGRGLCYPYCAWSDSEGIPLNRYFQCDRHCTEAR